MPIFNKELTDIEPYDNTLDCAFTDNYKIIGIIREPYKSKGYVFKCEDCNSLCWAPKRTIKLGMRFCKCTNSYVLTEDEAVVDIRILCKNRNFIFNKFDGKYKGNKTKLNLTCIKHNHTWSTTTYGNLKKGVGCYYCGLESQTLARTYTDDVMISRFNSTNMFCATFKKLHKDRWEVHCNICNCIYQSDAYHLQEGKRGCKCSGQYKRSEEEFIKDINYRLKSIKSSLIYHSFIKDTDKLTVNSKVILKCEQCGELHERTINQVVSKGSLCKCSTSTNYAYISNINDPDTNIVLGLKYGIESRYSSRVSKQNKESPFKVERLVTYRFENANAPYKAETHLKEYFKYGYLSKRDFPDGFTETVPATYYNIEFIKNIYEQYGGYEYYKE